MTQADITNAPIASAQEWADVFATTIGMMLDYLRVSELALADPRITNLQSNSFTKTLKSMWDVQNVSDKERGIILTPLIIGVSDVPFSEEVMSNLVRLRNYSALTGRGAAPRPEDLN